MNNILNAQKVCDFYDTSYEKLGFNAQRRYPNEELCRFMGRNFFSVPLGKRKEIKILEMGCGSGANLWMIAKEGFDAYGIDISQSGLSLCQTMLDNYGVSATIQTADMASAPFSDGYFDAVIDIFSSYCLTKQQSNDYLKNVNRMLKRGGIFFSYFPSKKSDTYQFPGNATFIDQDTLSTVLRKDSPFYGQDYPFRFIHPQEYELALLSLGFEIQYSEIVDRTYNHRKETFGFVVIEAKKT